MTGKLGPLPTATEASTLWTLHAHMDHIPASYQLEYHKPSHWRETTGHLTVETANQALAQRMADTFMGQDSASMIARVKYELNQYVLDLLMEEREGQQRTTRHAEEKYKTVKKLLDAISGMAIDGQPLTQFERDECCENSDPVARVAAQNKLREALYGPIFEALGENYALTSKINTPGGRLATRLHNSLDKVREHIFPSQLKAIDQGELPAGHTRWTLDTHKLTNGTHKQLKRFAVALTAFSGAHARPLEDTPEASKTNPLQKTAQTNSRPARLLNSVSWKARQAKAEKQKALNERNFPETFSEAGFAGNEFRMRLLNTINQNRKGFLKRFGISTAETLITGVGLLADFISEPFRYMWQEANDMAATDIWYVAAYKYFKSSSPGSYKTVGEQPENSDSGYNSNEKVVAQPENTAVKPTGIDNGFIIEPHVRYQANRTAFILPTLFYYVENTTIQSVNIGNRNPLKVTIAVSASAAFIALATQYQISNLIISEVVKKLHQLQFTGNLVGLTGAAKLTVVVCDVASQPDDNKMVQMRGWLDDQPFTLVLTLLGTAVTFVAAELGARIPQAALSRDHILELNTNLGTVYHTGEMIYLTRLQQLRSQEERIEGIGNQIIRAPFQILMPFVRLALSIFIGDPRRELYNLVEKSLSATSFLAKALLKLAPTLVFILGMAVNLLPRALLMMTSKIMGTLGATGVAEALAKAHVKLYEWNIAAFNGANHYLYELPYAYINKGIIILSDAIRPHPVIELNKKEAVNPSAKIPTLSFVLEEKAQQAVLATHSPQSVAFAFNHRQSIDKKIESIGSAHKVAQRPPRPS